MSLAPTYSVTLLTLALALGACGGGGGTGTGGTTASAGAGGSTGSGGGGGGTLPVIASCMAFCVAEKDCRPDTTVTDCYGYRCTNPVGVMPFDLQPPACQAAYQAFFDCLAAQPMVCDVPNGQANIPGDCVPQFQALSGANCNQS